MQRGTHRIKLECTFLSCEKKERKEERTKLCARKAFWVNINKKQMSSLSCHKSKLCPCTRPLWRDPSRFPGK